eukprot:COSAG01_NODE_648_length_14530_cov_206.392281_7_plen_259_part_00
MALVSQAASTLMDQTNDILVRIKPGGSGQGTQSLVRTDPKLRMTYTLQAAGSQCMNGIHEDGHLEGAAVPTLTSSAELARRGMARSHLSPCVLKVKVPPVKPRQHDANGALHTMQQQQPATAPPPGSRRLTTVADLSKACRASTAQLLALSADELRHMIDEAEADGHTIGMLGRQQIAHDVAVLQDMDTRAHLIIREVAAIKIQSMWRGWLLRRSRLSRRRTWQQHGHTASQSIPRRSRAKPSTMAPTTLPGTCSTDS